MEVALLLGTYKGGFLLRSDERRREWKLEGPVLPGWEFYHTVQDPRDGSLYAAVNTWDFGGMVAWSRDRGTTWEHSSRGLAYPDGQAGNESPGAKSSKLSRVWHVEPGPEGEPSVLYAGVEAAGLFRSQDQGVTWQEVPALRAHPTAAQWEPGGGGLCLHSITFEPFDPSRVYVGISAGGAYRTVDGGAHWEPINGGVQSAYPDVTGATGQCVHKILAHPARPRRVYQQNHTGVYRSDDGGETWWVIQEGLPSKYGFPLALHPRDPETAYVFPLTADTQRFAPEGRPAVWRTRDGGGTWERRDNGFPQDAYVVVRREGMATDRLDPVGVYVGTTTGQLFASTDEGDHWQLIADLLPPINSVGVAVWS
ncbi:WD40/YVTN/BNR-like repeat-containing protein [Limnochorda pilosa]|uniref:Glycoside hydrolase n=1 Tax=Limnochorda pilosa TaxID=1555112 RepID=A0A0K2SLI0_LIMPI|nr:hypothetical protein [Limnochorda pilosa]BAS27674.1 glycoside hydrolase [Limnochorda pilosa]